jgi:MFS family permease
MTDPALSGHRRTQLARNGDLLVFAVNGFGLASWLSRIPDVKDLLDLSPGSLGVVLLAISAGAVLGLPLAGRVAERIGATRAVRLGASLALPGVVFAAIASQAHASRPLVMLGLFLLGLGTGVWDVAQNLEGTAIERAMGRAIMPWFHAAFSLGAVLGALVGALLTWLEVPVAMHVGAVAALISAAVMWGTAQFLPAPERAIGADVSAGTTGASMASGWTETRTLLIGLMVLAAAFAEGSANDWMAVAFVDGHHVDHALGVVALASFLSFMTLGRIVGASVLDRYGRVPVLQLLFAATAVGCLLVVFGRTWLAFVGTAIWGVGVSLGFPVGMSAAADDPERAAIRLSVVSTIGYTAFLAGPPLLGFLGERFGVLNALLVVGAASALAILVVPAAQPLAHPKPRSAAL